MNRTRTSTSEVKRHTRNIEVWAGKRVLIEREGNTLSIQVRFPGGEKAAVVLDLEAAVELANILPDAVALVGETVGEAELVRTEDFA